MDLSALDITQLKALHALLTKSFRGASFGAWRVDDMANALKKAIDVAEADLAKRYPPPVQVSAQRHPDDN